MLHIFTSSLSKFEVFPQATSTQMATNKLLCSNKCWSLSNMPFFPNQVLCRPIKKPLWGHQHISCRRHGASIPKVLGSRPTEFTEDFFRCLPFPRHSKDETFKKWKKSGHKFMSMLSYQPPHRNFHLHHHCCHHNHHCFCHRITPLSPPPPPPPQPPHHCHHHHHTELSFAPNVRYKYSKTVVL